MITQAEIKSLLHYDPDTGFFVWLINKGSRAKCGSVASCRDSSGYIVITINQVTNRAHRWVWLYMYGEIPSGQIDHINGVAHDNRLLNLRCVSNQENHRNVKLHINNTSGTVGVWFNKSRRKWIAQITIDGITKYLGSFTEKKEAISTRKHHQSQCGFHQNHGRNMR